MAAVSHKYFSHLSLVFALNLGLRANRSDKTQALLGAGRRSKPGKWEQDGLWWVCPALQHFFTWLFPFSAPLRAFSSEPRITLRLLGPHLHRNYRDGLETRCENYCGCWQLVLIACACLSAPISTCIGDFLFAACSCEKKGDYWKLHFPAQIQKFLIFVIWELLCFGCRIFTV